MPSKPQTNKSPILYEEGHLGISTWCLPHLFKHTYLRLFRHSHTRSSNDSKSPTTHLHDQLPSTELIKLSRTLLLLQPDLVTLWNCRRHLILSGHLLVPSELKFSELVLQLKPKSATTFNYREWLFQAHHSSPTPSLVSDNAAERIGGDQAVDLLTEQRLQSELQLSLRCCEKYERNYYSWSHRAWIFQRLIPQIVGDNKDELYRRIVDDLAITRTYLEANISDYSCCHYRHILYRKLDSFGIPFERQYWNAITDEVEFCDRMLKLYTNKECFLLHRRAMISFVLRFRPHEQSLCQETEQYLFGLNRNNLDVFPENSLQF